MLRSSILLSLLLAAIAAGGIAWHFMRKQSSPTAGDQERQRSDPHLVDAADDLSQQEADELAAQGRKGVLELAHRLEEGSKNSQITSLRALRNLGPDAQPAVNAMIPLLRTGDRNTKRLAAQALGAVGPRARPAIPALIEAARETEDFDGSFTKGGASNVAEAALAAVQQIDANALPLLAEAITPGLLEVVRAGREGPSSNALAILLALGSHARASLPQLTAMLAHLPPRTAGEALPLFLGAGEEGMALVAEVMLDPTTQDEVKIGLLRGYRREQQTSPSTVRILRALLHDRSARLRVAALLVLQTARAKELIPDLVPLLADDALLNVRSDFKGDDQFHATRALGNQGKDALPALTKALTHDLPLARFQAVRAMSLMGKDAADAVFALEQALNDTVPRVRMEAAKAILKTGKESTKAWEQVSKHLDPDSQFVRPALQAVRELGPAGHPALPAVRRLVLQSSDFSLQRDGFWAMQGMQADPKEIVLAWAALVRRNSQFLFFIPEAELRAHGTEVREIVPVLVAYLRDRDQNVGRWATDALAAMGPAATDAIPALLRLIDEDTSSRIGRARTKHDGGSFHVADGAVTALGAMGDAAKVAIPSLLRKFEQVNAKDMEPEYERRSVLEAIEHIGPGAVEAVPRLLDWLPEHPRIARVLGKIGPGAKAAIEPLQKMYRQKAGFGKTWAAFALVRITGESEPFVGHLAQVFDQGKNPTDRREALLALVELGPDARPALPTLLRAVKEKGPAESLHEFRHEAACALVHFGPAAKDAVPALIDMVLTSYFTGKIAAAEALGAIGPEAKEAIPALSQMAGEDVRFRPVVEKALARIRAR
jgi:HEAT repeat protein